MLTEEQLKNTCPPQVHDVLFQFVYIGWLLDFGIRACIPRRDYSQMHSRFPIISYDLSSILIDWHYGLFFIVITFFF